MCPLYLTSGSRARANRKREKLGNTDIGKNLAFDEKMKQDQEGMVKMMYGGSAVMIGGILAILLPLLASQPDA